MIALIYWTVAALACSVLGVSLALLAYFEWRWGFVADSWGHHTVLALFCLAFAAVGLSEASRRWDELQDARP